MDDEPKETQKVEEIQKLEIDEKMISKKSLLFYYYSGIPEIGILSHIGDESSLSPFDKELRRQLCLNYLDSSLTYFIKNKDWRRLFVGLKADIHEISSLMYLSESEAFDYVERKLELLKTPKLKVSWYLAMGEHEKASTVIDSLSLEVKIDT